MEWRDPGIGLTLITERLVEFQLAVADPSTSTENLKIVSMLHHYIWIAYIKTDVYIKFTLEFLRMLQVWSNWFAIFQIFLKLNQCFSTFSVLIGVGIGKICHSCKNFYQMFIYLFIVLLIFSFLGIAFIQIMGIALACWLSSGLLILCKNLFKHI